MKTLKHLKTALLAASLVALPAVSALAQTTTSQQRHSINARDQRQQNRINKGVADGQITRRAQPQPTPVRPG